MATEILRPTGNLATLWSTYDYTNVSDLITQPAAGNGVYAVADSNDDNEEQLWQLGRAALSTATTADLWVYARGDAVKTITCRLYIAGAWTATQTFATTTSVAWYNLTFSGSWTIGDFSDFRVGIQVPTIDVGQNQYFDVIYVQLTGGATTNAEYLDPVSNIFNTWSDGDYTNINDGVREPTDPTTSGDGFYALAADKSDNHDESSWATNDVSNLGVATLISFVIYNTNSTDISSVQGNVRIGGIFQTGSTAWLPTLQDGWIRLNFSGSWPMTTLTSMGFALEPSGLSNGEFWRVHAAYLEVDYVPASTYNQTGQGGVVGGSSAVPFANYTVAIAAKGVLCDSIATFNTTFSKTASGGTLGGGQAIVAVSVFATGGAVVNGSNFITHSFTASGGTKVGTSFDFNFLYNPVGNGGAIVGSQILILYNISGSGGAIAGGEANEAQLVISNGGVIIGGIAIADFSSVSSSGGTIIGSSAIVSCQYYITADGGILGSGQTLTINNVIADGGTIVGGEALKVLKIIIGGGTFVSGSALNECQHNFTISGGTICSGVVGIDVVLTNFTSNPDGFIIIIGGQALTSIFVFRSKKPRPHKIIFYDVNDSDIEGHWENAWQDKWKDAADNAERDSSISGKWEKSWQGKWLPEFETWLAPHPSPINHSVPQANDPVSGHSPERILITSAGTIVLFKKE